MTDQPRLHVATPGQLDVPTLYALLALRVDVFVVEQQCPYSELDGRDLEPGALHLWFDHDDSPVAYLRLLTDPDGTCRIGRVLVLPAARGTGLAGQLMDAALARVGQRRCVLHAQSHLVEFYRRYGFSPTGPEFLDDGIPHVPMARAAVTAGS
ncbi:GNAT family N-acetyltransferase [Actinobacteria bacterium YIM 96077]|uniref:GNAT family N-acetyltransferase n=1 Tax=Phytoactinopolyspora halophila TaxID=1981511 RepID=A0A329QYA7_9ACTN|nr:GNAT family N-acetyltransferase [Phytoactinopolyspora halophila]AYY13405.1 GNAT family N-acetyltransferase [Actinobacteria bacterium YIM 96077]RAW17360.1 GNAT family N-acetyltransferase [Phytoactinopolyspora halophila]